MANASILAAFERMWQHVVAALGNKSDINHSHAASNITSGTLSSDRLPTVPIDKGGTGATTAAAALTNLGITATAAELNKMDGVTATTTELNYVDGVTSAIQEQLDAKADTSHTHDDYMTVIHPAGAGYFSLNRKSGTTAGDCSFAEGYNGTASGHVSHAEGDTTTASGNYSHSEGAKTTASGAWSHAEGYYSTASGSYSHAEGYSTIATGDGQHAQGMYNIEDTEGKYAHIVGNGTVNARANIHTLDWDGNAWFEGNVKVGGTSYSDAYELASVSYVDNNTNNKVPTSRTVNGKALSSNISLTASDVGATSFTPVTVSIDASAWSSNTATVSCSAVTSTNTLIVAPAPSSYATWGNSKIRASAQAAESITFTCDTTPTDTVNVNIVALG